VQHNRNGYVFENIGFVKGYETTLRTQNYTFEDKRRLNSLAYYRLKQEDYDGKIDFSNIITGSSKVKIYLTLTSGELRIDEANTFIITNTNGQVVFTQTSNYQHSFTIAHLPNGMYIIKRLGY
jgi:hypothetical protein